MGIFDVSQNHKAFKRYCVNTEKSALSGFYHVLSYCRNILNYFGIERRFKWLRKYGNYLILGWQRQWKKLHLFSYEQLKCSLVCLPHYLLIWCFLGRDKRIPGRLPLSPRIDRPRGRPMPPQGDRLVAYCCWRPVVFKPSLNTKDLQLELWNFLNHLSLCCTASV